MPDALFLDLMKAQSFPRLFTENRAFSVKRAANSSKGDQSRSFVESETPFRVLLVAKTVVAHW